MKIKLIVTDLDNTLLKTDKTVTNYTEDILIKLKDIGYKIAFATARPERTSSHFLNRFKPDYIISNNGARIIKEDNIIYNNPIKASIINSLLDDIIGSNKLMCSSIEMGEYNLTDYKGEITDSWSSISNLEYYDFKKPVGDILKASFETKDTDWLSENVNKYEELHLYENHGEDWHQVMEKNSTKFNGINYIVDELNIDLSQVLVFGDDYNDIEMIKKAGIGICMENGVKEAKEIADYICENNENDGVAKWLDENINLL